MAKMRVRLFINEVSLFATHGMLIVARKPNSWIFNPTCWYQIFQRLADWRGISKVNLFIGVLSADEHIASLCHIILAWLDRPLHHNPGMQQRLSDIS